MPSPEALEQLRLVLAHNDANPGNFARVSRAATIEMLNSHGWPGGPARLDKVCRALGRKSWSRAV